MIIDSTKGIRGGASTLGQGKHRGFLGPLHRKRDLRLIWGCAIENKLQKRHNLSCKITLGIYHRRTRRGRFSQAIDARLKLDLILKIYKSLTARP